MQPLLLLANITAILAQQICRSEQRATSEVLRINSHDERVFSILGGEVLRNCFGMSRVVVYGDEWRGDVGLLVDVRDSEARESAGVVYDCGLVLGEEAGLEGVAGLG
jgi:hypothetical protein